MDRAECLRGGVYSRMEGGVGPALVQAEEKERWERLQHFFLGPWLGPG